MRVVASKVLLVALILLVSVADAGRVRRRRRQAVLNAVDQANPQILNDPARTGKNGMAGGGRQYYPYQGQSGYGSIQGLNYPYAGAGVGSYQYGQGQYGQSMGAYGGYYNQYPGSNSFYGGYNSGGGYNNRPSYSASYWSPQSGSGYFWNSGQGNRVNIGTILLSSLISFFCYSIFA